VGEWSATRKLCRSKLPRSLRIPWPQAEGSSGAKRRSRVEVTRSFTSFSSGTGGRWRRPSPTGFGRHTTCPICWSQTPTRSTPTRHRNLDQGRRKRTLLGKASPPGSQSAGNHEGGLAAHSYRRKIAIALKMAWAGVRVGIRTFPRGSTMPLAVRDSPTSSARKASNRSAHSDNTR
jgi:hypothetical protein